MERLCSLTLHSDPMQRCLLVGEGSTVGSTAPNPCLDFLLCEQAISVVPAWALGGCRTSWWEQGSRRGRMWWALKKCSSCSVTVFFLLLLFIIWCTFLIYPPKYFLFSLSLVCSVSSVQSLSHVQLFATPWTAAHQASLSITNTWSLLRLMSIEFVMPSKTSHPLLSPSPPSLIFPSIRVFSNELVLLSGGQNIGASASASVLPMNIQD